MARAALPGRLTWQLGARGRAGRRDRAGARASCSSCPAGPGHRAGQHVDVRLTAEDGYQAQRSYSIASAPEDDQLVLTVERLDDGEVSPYLVDELRAGRRARAARADRRLLRVGGVARRAAAAGRRRLGRSCRCARCCATGRRPAARSRCGCCTRSRSLGRGHLPRGADRLAAATTAVDVRFALTREWPEGWTGHTGRIDRRCSSRSPGRRADAALIYVCGPSGFVETRGEAGWSSSGTRRSGSGPSGSARRGPERTESLERGLRRRAVGTLVPRAPGSGLWPSCSGALMLHVRSRTCTNLHVRVRSGDADRRASCLDPGPAARPGPRAGHRSERRARRLVGHDSPRPA